MSFHSQMNNEWQHAVPVREASTRGGVEFSIWRAAARRRQLSKAPSSRRTPKSQQQAQDQFCPSLHAKLDKDVAEMKLNGLFGNHQAQTNLSVSQALGT